MSSVNEIGNRLVSLCSSGKGMEALDTLYAKDIVSVEAEGSPELPARLEGIEAIRGKNEWWYANNEVHSTSARGPYIGHREDQFIVQFDLNVTPKDTGKRMQMQEVGLYTVAGGKVAQEEFLYLMA